MRLEASTLAARRFAISEVLRSKAKQNLRGGFREAAAGYSVLYDVHVFL